MARDQWINGNAASCMSILSIEPRTVLTDCHMVEAKHTRYVVDLEQNRVALEALR